MQTFTLVALFVVLCCAVADEAKLFFYKTTETSPVVQNRDFVISYKLHNAGEGPAYNVEITDRYDQKDFSVKSHSAVDNVITIAVPEVLPMDTHEVNVTVVPLKFGGYVPTLAKVKYSGGADRILSSGDEDDEEMDEEMDLDGEVREESPAETGTIGYSTSVGSLEIVEEELFVRRQSEFNFDRISINHIIFLVGAIFLYTVIKASMDKAAAKKAARRKASTPITSPSPSKKKSASKKKGSAKKD
jgi:hypothetical protein